MKYFVELKHEFNILAATINDTLFVGTTLDRPGISDFVHEMKIDLDLWFEYVFRLTYNTVD